MLKDRIDADLKEAMKAKDMEKLNVLRMVKAAFKNEEIAKKHELTAEEEISVLDRLAKQRMDSVNQYRAAGREDLAQGEEKEIAIIDVYRPQKMDEAEVRAEVKKLLAESEVQDFGRAMKNVMAALKGKADGGLISKIVKEEMQND